MQMIKEGASPFGSVLGSPLLAFHSQLSSLGWPCLRIESLCLFVLELNCSWLWLDHTSHPDPMVEVFIRQGRY